MPVDAALRAMADHSADNPTHGYNCACKDAMIRDARAELSPNELDELRYLARVLCQ